MATNIVVPQRILLTLGVDIFKDLRYDTWVLQTIWARIRNNAFGGVQEGPMGSLTSFWVGPLYSFMNHSCEPNAESDDVAVTYRPVTAPIFRSSTKAIIATREIRRGEEISVSYIADVQKLDRTAR